MAASRCQGGSVAAGPTQASQSQLACQTQGRDPASSLCWRPKGRSCHMAEGGLQGQTTSRLVPRCLESQDLCAHSEKG